MRAVFRYATYALAAGLLTVPAHAAAQDEPRCVFLCAPELKVEPTWTVENLAGRPRISAGGLVERARRETVFEMIFAVDIPTTLPRIGTTFEASFAPFQDGNEVELEAELNIHLFDTK